MKNKQLKIVVVGAGGTISPLIDNLSHEMTNENVKFVKVGFGFGDENSRVTETHKHKVPLWVFGLKRWLDKIWLEYFVGLENLKYKNKGAEMDKSVFSKKVEQYIKNEMLICIDDLTNKILQDAPNNSQFFNTLFEYMIDLKTPYTYDYDNLSNPNNFKFRRHLEKKLYGFLEENGFTEDSKEYPILDVICHCFISFKENGIVRMYKYRLTESWYPKVMITKFIGIREDIDELDEEILIFRGTSQEEFDSGIFGQSWSLSKNIAKEFAFSTYKREAHYKNTLRVVLSTIIKKDSIFFYDKNSKEHKREDEVIINTKTLYKNLVVIEEKQSLKG